MVKYVERLVKYIVCQKDLEAEDSPNEEIMNTFKVRVRKEDFGFISSKKVKKLIITNFPKFFKLEFRARLSFQDAVLHLYKH